MKIIFLDFDGVLNSDRYIKQHNGAICIDPSKMPLLKQIVNSTGAQIVLTTSWREHWSAQSEACDSTGALINRLFSEYGLRILDKTPRLHAGRETEIKNWLEKHPVVTHFVVLDDMLLSADFLTGHFVKTSNYFGGLHETDVERAIHILNR